MRIAFIALLFAASTCAQSQSAVVPAACGPSDISFKVKLDDSQHTLAQPEPGKALVYFIQDKGLQSFGIGGTVETRIGLDGTWIGANKNNSYFYVYVGPGEHHVCANVQSSVMYPMELTRFTAEAEKAYYFRVRVVPTPYGLYLFLDPVDSDEANYLIATFPVSVSHPYTQEAPRQSVQRNTR